MLRVLHDLLMVSPSCRGAVPAMTPPPWDPDMVRAGLNRAYSTLLERHGAEGAMLVVAAVCQGELDKVGYTGPPIGTSNPQHLLLAVAWVVGLDSVLARWVTAAGTNLAGATHEDTARLAPATDAAQQAAALAATKHSNRQTSAAASFAGSAAGYDGYSSGGRAAGNLDATTP